MITTLMNQKRRLNRFNELPDDGDPWVQEARTNKTKTPVEPRWAKQQTRSSGPNHLK